MNTFGKASKKLVYYPPNGLNISLVLVILKKGKGIMINATQMAKPFGKKPSDWLRTGPAQEFLSALSTVKHICETDLVRVAQGGTIQGTWFHEDVSLEFARWLSPVFAIWCNDRIKEMLPIDVYRRFWARLIG